MSGDSHTGFNSGVFTLGAVGGATLLASSLVLGMQNAVQQASHRRWSRWTRNQVELALDLSEGLRKMQYEEAEQLRVENARLKAALRRLTVRRVS